MARNVIYSGSSGMKYGNTSPGQISTLGDITYDYVTLRNIIETTQEHDSTFSNFVDHTNIPLHSGRTISATVYHRMLSDHNINDQGINSRGLKTPYGNFGGQWQDFDTFAENTPDLPEDGGRVNRGGISTSNYQASLNEYGIFIEWNRSLFAYRKDGAFLQDHALNELVTTAHRFNENMIQMDIVYSASTLVFSGTALRQQDLGVGDYVSFNTVNQLERSLNLVGAPKNTTLITGTDKVGTVTNHTNRFLITHPDLVYHLQNLVDGHGNPAFKPIETYAAGLKGGPVANEVGSIGRFRVLCPNNMMYWKGRGALVNAQDPIEQSINKYGERRANVYPMICICKNSFTAVKFNQLGLKGTDNGTAFTIICKKPGVDTASAMEPYGRNGFASIQWSYGFLAYQPQFIGLIQTALPSIVF